MVGRNLYAWMSFWLRGDLFGGWCDRTMGELCLYAKTVEQAQIQTIQQGVNSFNAPDSQVHQDAKTGCSLV